MHVGSKNEENRFVESNPLFKCMTKSLTSGTLFNTNIKPKDYVKISVPHKQIYYPLRLFLDGHQQCVKDCAWWWAEETNKKDSQTFEEDTEFIISISGSESHNWKVTHHDNDDLFPHSAFVFCGFTLAFVQYLSLEVKMSFAFPSLSPVTHG